MCKLSLIIGAIVCIFISVVYSQDIYYCPMHPSYTSDKSGDCPICNMKLVKKETESSLAGHEGHTVHKEKDEKLPEDICIEHDCTMKDCIMKVKVDWKPGEKIVCPICGEYITSETGKLIKVREGKISEDVSVVISAEKQQLIGVKTVPIKKMNLNKKIRASGKIAYDPELGVAQEEFVQSLNNEDRVRDSRLPDVIARARSLTDAARKRLRLLGMGDENISELEKNRKTDTSLYLPEKGGKIWAYFSIYEYEIGMVKNGLLVRVEAIAYPGEIFEGKISSISPVLDPVTRTNQIRVEVDNSENKLKPEMFASGEINIDLGEKLAVPESSVLDTGIRKIVYLSRDEGTFEAREIKVGNKAEDYYEVIDGINEGDVVVVSGNFFIDAESRLKSALRGGEHKH